ncbi:MAG: hypothetical protein IPI21_12980 [Propionivibrio sp.]|nr:hypothetical protein [Propionivibrio sp.]
MKWPNPAVDPAPFGRWTLRDKAAQAAHFYYKGFPEFARARDGFSVHRFS